jgi:NAD(P)H-hydrate epimerase
MERAASACTEYILGYSSPDDRYIVVCGKGNNGGDGLAIARMLIHAAHQVDVFILEYTDSSSPDFAANMELLKQIPSLRLHHITSTADLKIESTNGTIIIDAILGTGINKPTDGLIAETIELINKSGTKVISIDVPSGLPIDELMPQKWAVIKAITTLTFQQPKLAFLFPESGDYVGDCKVLNIGIDDKYTASLESQYYFLQDRDIMPLMLSRSKFSHKGTYGHSLLISGSYGKMGAAVLSSHACLCSGTGLLTTHIPSVGYQIIQTALPEAMVSIDPAADHITTLPPLEAYTSIGIGPGIGQHPDTAKALKLLIQSTPCPLVIDADALNIISENKTWLGFLPPRSILTPHPKEFDRLTEKHSNSWERLASAQALAHKHSIIIVLKGAYTATVMPDRTVWFNSTGNPALAKGGSGDVLTGVITALISRGYEASDAAFIGVYMHGLAADIAIQDIHPESLLASDVIAYISEAFEYLYGEIE